MWPSCWHKSFGPNGLSAPAQGLCLNCLSSNTADFNISSALRWVIQDQWASGFPFRLTCHCRVMPLFRLLHCKPMEPGEQNICRISWPRIMIFGSDCVQGVEGLINFWQNSVIFGWIISLFPLVHCKPMEPCEQKNIWQTAWARIMIFGI